MNSGFNLSINEMMNKLNKGFFVFFVLLLSINSYAQRGGQDQSKIQSMKIGMITENLNLDSEQAERFWPVYNAYESEKRAIIRQIRHLQKEIASGELAAQAAIDAEEKILKLKKEELSVTSSFKAKFLQVISTNQYAALIRTERQFHDMLMNRLREVKQ
jgi:Spy/CpxP family protein refolding chaperone